MMSPFLSDLVNVDPISDIWLIPLLLIAMLVLLTWAWWRGQGKK